MYQPRGYLKTFYVFQVASCQLASSFSIIPPLISTIRKYIMPSPISIGSTALLAGLVCLTVGCASLDTRMKRFVGKPIDAVIKSYGVEPTEGRVKSGNNRYAYLWRYTYYSYGGREYEGSSQNGPIITNYYSDVCYGQNQDRIFYTDDQGIIVDYYWQNSNKWRVNCRTHQIGRYFRRSL